MNLYSYIMISIVSISATDDGLFGGWHLQIDWTQTIVSRQNDSDASNYYTKDSLLAFHLQHCQTPETNLRREFSSTVFHSNALGFQKCKLLGIEFVHQTRRGERFSIR